MARSFTFHSSKGHHSLRKLLLLSIRQLSYVPRASQAAPIYADGNTCPTRTGSRPRPQSAVQRGAGAAVRVRRVPPIIQGDQAEADLYLNSAAGALAGWQDILDLTDNWTGLGQDSLGLNEDPGG